MTDRSELALQLTDAIAVARTAVERAGDRAFRAYGLSHRAHAALNAVDQGGPDGARPKDIAAALGVSRAAATTLDRKSTRLNSSHSQISYAVFCLKKKKKNKLLIQHNIPTAKINIGNPNPRLLATPRLKTRSLNVSTVSSHETSHLRLTRRYETGM